VSSDNSSVPPPSSPQKLLEKQTQFALYSQQKSTCQSLLVELARHEIKLHRQRIALRAAAGAWKAEDHPELAEGAAKWVREIRQESARRYEEIQQRRETQ